MRYTLLAMAAAFAAVHAADDCDAEYNACIAKGTAEVACSCDRTACYGEDAARIREWCASQTANLPKATSYAAASSIITGTAGSQPSGQPPVTAAAGSLKLGETCSDDKQCANGVQCWGSNAGIIRRCGNFNAACSKNEQCAYNTCNNGLCNGFLASSEYPANTVSSTAAPSSSGYACNPAHEYPEGRKCVSTNGGLTLLPATTSAPSAQSTGYACNPAHEYPEGRKCVSTNGGLTLLPATTSAPSAQSTGYACNPAHAYPAGQVCTEINGSLTLVTGGSPTGGAAAPTTPLICNAAAIARGDCTATAASVPTTPLICNAAAIARGDCSATAASVPTSAPVQGGIYAAPSYGAGNGTQATGTGAAVPSGTGVTPYTGGAGAAEILSGFAAVVAGAVAFVL